MRRLLGWMAILFVAVVFGAGSRTLEACTAFCAVGGGQVLVGNNEDYFNPRTKIWFVPAKPGAFGRVYVGFDDLWPQGGMNERGLWFDGFATPAVRITDTGLPSFPGNIIDTAMAECGSVEDVVRLFERYNRAFLSEAVLMFADASGDAVSIEANAIVRKTRNHFVQTNFHQSRSDGRGDARFSTANAMLERAGGEISIDLFRRILDATHQSGGAPTLYSNIYELKSRTMYLYNFHDFDHVVTLRLDDELKKGERVLDIKALFPANPAAEKFATDRPASSAGLQGGAILTLLATAAAAALAGVIYGWIRIGRRFRIGVAAGAIGIAATVVLVAFTLGTHGRTDAPWIQFSIGPASGDSFQMGQGSIRSNGLTVKAAIAIANDVPAVRVIGPSWIASTRYAITAVAGIDDEESFRPWLQQELTTRMRLETHRETRPLDTFVLTATARPQLEPAAGTKPGGSIQKDALQYRDATLAQFAAVLQMALGKPVIDETGVDGHYNFTIEWRGDPAADITAALHDRYGLSLTPATRDFEVLVVDHIRRDAALVLLDHAAWLTRGAPAVLQPHLSRLLTIR